jgi:signal transduction histidine kinase
VSSLQIALLDSRGKNIKGIKNGFEFHVGPDMVLGSQTDLWRGEILETLALKVGDNRLGFLKIQSRYPWKKVIDQSAWILLAFLTLFLLFKLGVWIWVRVLNRSVVLPLETMAKELAKERGELEQLSPLKLEQREFMSAPTEVAVLVESYNRMVHTIQTLREKENSFVAAAARIEVARQVAHDIRSPSAALSLALEGMENIPSKSKEILLNVLKRMNDIAQELLVMEQNFEIQAKELKKNGSPVAVAIKPIVIAIMEEKKILLVNSPHLALRVDKISDCLVLGGEAELKRALSNLIDNAIEASEEKGEIVVKATVIADICYLSVKDNGKGIAKEDLSRVWAPGVSLGKKNGHGFGLSFVRDVVESWGGRTVLDSALGKGTVVSLQLKVYEKNNKDSL